MKALRAEDGMTLIEVLVAVIVLTIGIMGAVYSFDTSRKLTLTSERRSSIAHLAQREIERLQSVPYSELAMVSAPKHVAETTNPDYYVDYTSPVACKEITEGSGCFAWNVEKTTEEEPLVVSTRHEECGETPIEGCGKVSPEPKNRPCELNPVGSCEWTEQQGHLSGNIYDFVTWHTDGEAAKKDCGEGCPSENDYKRVTVIVTVNVPNGTQAVVPVRASTLIANVNAAPKEGTISNPLKNPNTTCGKEEKCVAGISGNARSWFLHDSGTQEDEEKAKVEPPSEHITHATVAPSQITSCSSSNHSGCPRPDLMDEGAPTTTTLYDYSTDQNASGYTDMLSSGLASKEPFTEGRGGRRLETGVTCETEPTGTEPNANLKSEMWVTKPLSATAETTLTGAGGLSLYTQTVGGLSGAGTLCLGLYDVPSSIDGLWLTAESSPTLIGYTSYATAEWPKGLQNLSFTFEPCVEPCATRHLVNSKKEAVKAVKIAAGHRIGLRIWPAAAPADGLAISYDTTPETKTEKPGYPSLLQLNTE